MNIILNISWTYMVIIRCVYYI